MTKEERKEYYKKYYQANRDRLLANQKQYYQANKDRLLANQKQYKLAHAEEIKEQKKQYYLDHAEEIKEQKKQYRLDHADERKQYNLAHAEEIKEQKKQYYLDHAEEIKEQKKQYRLDNADKIKKYKKQYQQTKGGRAKELIKSYRRCDKKRGFCISNNITSDWIVQNIFSGQSCVYCGDSDWTHLGCDRIDNDKPHTPDNVVCSCGICNIERNDRYSIEEFKEYRKLNPRTLDTGIDKSWEIVEMDGVNIIKKKIDNARVSA